MAKWCRNGVVNASHIAKLITERNDNIYHKKVVGNILDMHMDECRGGGDEQPAVKKH